MCAEIIRDPEEVLEDAMESAQACSCLFPFSLFELDIVLEDAGHPSLLQQHVPNAI